MRPLKRTLYTLAQYSKERGLLMSYTRQSTSQARSASDRKSKSGITSWSWEQKERECVEDGSINILKNADTQQSVIHPD